MTQTAAPSNPSTVQQHLLYVAWGYPPSRGAGMYRTLATANSFVEQGWSVTVLTTTRDTFESLTSGDTEAEKYIDPRISVVRVPFDLARGETDLSKWPRVRANLPLWWSLGRSMRERWHFPEDVYGGWKPALVDAAVRVHLRHAVSLVLGSANPNVDFAPGDYLNRAYGIPYVMDYRDAWHLDISTGKTLGSRIGRSSRIERRLIGNASEVWFVNQQILDWHSTKYPENSRRFQVVSNGFDEVFLTNLSTKPRSDTALVFGYLGMIYGTMPLQECLEGWRLARQESRLLKNSRLVFRGHLGHSSVPNTALVALIAEFAVDEVSYGGPVSKTSVAEVYNGFDALLLTLPSSPYITSGKVFEYAATGLPITSVHGNDSAASEILQGHPFWHLAPEMTPESIAEAFVKTAKSARGLTSTDIYNTRKWASKYSRDQQLLPRIASLAEVARR